MPRPRLAYRFRIHFTLITLLFLVRHLVLATPIAAQYPFRAMQLARQNPPISPFLDGAAQKGGPKTPGSPHPLNAYVPQRSTPLTTLPPIRVGERRLWAEVTPTVSVIFATDAPQQPPYRILTRPGAILSLAADTDYLAWVERDPQTQQLAIYAYNLRTTQLERHQQLELPSDWAEIAVGGGTLAVTSRHGLVLHQLADGSQVTVSTNAQRPVACAEGVLWSERHADGSEPFPVWSLYLRSSAGVQLIASHQAGYAGLSGYACGDGWIAWAFAPPARDTDLLAQPVAGGPIYRLGPARGSGIQISNGELTWEDVEGAGAGEALRWNLGGSLQPRRLRGTSEVSVQGDAVGGASGCNPTIASSCGQVAISRTQFSDLAGPWQARGVQFFLPQYGINDATFYDNNYGTATLAGTTDRWLDRAQRELHTNLLRIYVELPYRQSDGTLVAPTNYTTIFDFLYRANLRGMRLGISLHNSADWTMTTERRTWITGLLDYLITNNAIAALAYINADNEINNHCGGSARDCFDSTVTFNAQPYINGALEWVAQLRSVVKARAPSVLLTVGISTEMGDTDNTRAAFNFFRADSQGRTLARLVDFLAPHNYGGGAAGIADDIRYTGYTAPLLLEEYGFPTDPFPRNALWTEGDPSCRVAPLQARCYNTAPYFVETNLQFARSRGYAGSVAWMLADMQAKDTANACNDPNRTFDLWTGLFAIGGAYCAGGTYTRGEGQLKATGFRVCVAYAGTAGLCGYRVYVPTVQR